MRQGQKYVVRCVKAISRSQVGLGHDGKYRKGDFISDSDDGAPVRKLDKAAIYVHGTKQPSELEFGFDDLYDWGCLGDYFEPCPVKVKTTVVFED